MDLTYIALTGSSAGMTTDLLDAAFDRLVAVENVGSVDAALDEDGTFSFLLGIDTSTASAEVTVAAAQAELTTLGLSATVTE